jgi:histidyl-tRNA synthetase
LKQRGIEFEIVPRLVRGLDYYTKTTFEITSGALGSQNAVLGGGRYDGLSEVLGGPPAPGFGFSIGEDRLVMVVEESLREADRAQAWAPKLDAYIAWIGDAALVPASTLASELRRQDFRIEIGYEPAKLKKAMGAASKLGAQFAVIIGEGELATGKYQVKNMSTGEQEEVPPDQIPVYLTKRPDSRVSSNSLAEQIPTLPANS